MLGLFFAYVCLDMCFEKHVRKSSSIVKKTSKILKCGFVEDIDTWLSKEVDPLDVFYKNHRFDLIYKIKWAQAVNSSEPGRAFFRNNYLQIIEYGGVDFMQLEKKQQEFDKLLRNISKNGFDDKLPIIVSKKWQVVDGAHRLAACIALGRKIKIKSNGGLLVERSMDYRWFLHSGLPVLMADWGALEYVKLNPNTFIFNLFPLLPISFDGKVERILNKHGFIYYKKSLPLTLIGCINIKRISYSSELFAGDVFFEKNAREAMGGVENGTLRALVFIGKSLECVWLAKKEIRGLLQVGNAPVHSSDFKDEVVALAEMYFNSNSWHKVNHHLFNLSTSKPNRVL